MLYRRSAQLAVQASILLALQPEGQSCPVRELAAALSVPATYLTKVLQLLTHAGLLRANRGPNGGVHLALSPKELSLWDVLSAVEPAGEFERCLLGIGRCNDSNPCALHESWAPVRAQIVQMLRDRTLWEFACQARDKGVLQMAPVRAAQHGGCGRSAP